MKSLCKALIVCLMLLALLVPSGCISCIPQYMAPPMGPVSPCYPTGHDPYIPMDHNPTAISPWDWLASLFTPFMYGPPR